jgi:hypothetical protein
LRSKAPCRCQHPANDKLPSRSRRGQHARGRRRDAAHDRRRVQNPVSTILRCIYQKHHENNKAPIANPIPAHAAIRDMQALPLFVRRTKWRLVSDTASDASDLVHVFAKIGRSFAPSPPSCCFMSSGVSGALLGRLRVAWRSREVIVQCCRATRKRNQASGVMRSPAAASDALPRVASDMSSRLPVADN